MVRWPSASLARTLGRVMVIGTCGFLLVFDKSGHLAEPRRDDGRGRQRGMDGFDGFEPVAGDAQHDFVVGLEVPGFGELQRRGDGRAAGGLRENSRGLSEYADTAHDRVVTDGARRTTRLANRAH